MRDYRDLDDVTRKRLEKNNEKMKEMVEDEKVRQMLVNAREKELKDDYIADTEKILESLDEVEQAFVIVDKYAETIQNMIDAINAENKKKSGMWFTRYCWISPYLVTAGYSIMDKMGENMDDYMDAYVEPGSVSGKESAKIAMEEINKVTRKNMKEKPKEVASAIVRVLSVEFTLGQYFYEV